MNLNFKTQVTAEEYLQQFVCSLLQIIMEYQTNFLLYSLHYAEAGPIFALSHLRATKLLSKKCRSGGEPLATLRAI